MSWGATTSPFSGSAPAERTASPTTTATTTTTTTLLLLLLLLLLAATAAHPLTPPLLLMTLLLWKSVSRSFESFNAGVRRAEGRGLS
ncbi:MAG: hypothetical protein WKF84_00015 [Pyrinomonadaceae bacterium]